jgi:hypothetical protein
MRPARRIPAVVLVLGMGLLPIAPARARPQETAPPAGDDAVLGGILDKTRAYCRRLDDFAFELRCREVETQVLPSAPKVWLVMPIRRRPVAEPTLSVAKAEIRNVFVYTYDLIREQRISHENRILKQVNGRPERMLNAGLQGVRYRFDFPAFLPVEIFGEAGRLRHEFRIVGREAFKGEKAVIVDAVPNVKTIDFNPGARAWVREGDSAVLKIEWDASTLPVDREVKTGVDVLNATPIVTFVTEYGVEKDGFRFPSRLFIREAYRQAETGETAVAFEITVVYEDYRFLRIVPDPVEDDEEDS